jgi:hypothetical protein
MADPPFVQSLFRQLHKNGFRFAISFRKRESPRVNERLKARVYSSGWPALTGWLSSVGLMNVKHLSKVLVAER